MAIHVRELEELRRLAHEAEASPRLRPAPAGACARCADLGAAILVLVAEVERLRAPYARAFRDGADGALDFAARTFGAMGDPVVARVLQSLRATIKD